MSNTSAVDHQLGWHGEEDYILLRTRQCELQHFFASRDFYQCPIKLGLQQPHSDEGMSSLRSCHELKSMNCIKNACVTYAPVGAGQTLHFNIALEIGLKIPTFFCRPLVRRNAFLSAEYALLRGKYFAQNANPNSQKARSEQQRKYSQGASRMSMFQSEHDRAQSDAQANKGDNTYHSQPC